MAESKDRNQEENSSRGGNTKGKAGLEIRSSEVQEILGGVPSWIVRYGTFMFVAVIFMIIAFSFVFNYPDILRSNIVVTTQNPPATIVARTTGKIEQLFVTDNQKVGRGQMIALIENPASYNDILKLKAVIDSVQPDFDTLNFTPAVRFSKNLQLGYNPGKLFAVSDKAGRTAGFYAAGLLPEKEGIAAGTG